jgi:hypothetical protein
MKKIFLALLVLVAVFNVTAKDKARAFVYYYDQPAGLYDYFIKDDNGKWVEMSSIKNTVKFRFKTISEEPEQTVLFDEDRSTYLRLTASKCFIGQSKGDITRQLYDGYWAEMNGPTAASFLEKGTDIFVYEKKECKGFFVKSGNQYMEYGYKNGMVLNTYAIVEAKSDHIILRCNRGGYYVKLTANCCCYATSEHGSYSKMYCGTWSGKGLSKKSSKSDQGSLSKGDRAFAYYLKGKYSSYFGYYTEVSDGYWDEIRISDDKVLFHYKLISESATEIILFDEKRSVYVRLTGNESYWGESKTDITHKTYDGAWVGFDYGYSVAMWLELDINIFIFESASYSGYYMRSYDGYWVEYAYGGGYPVNTYIIIEEAPTYVLVFCEKCGIYEKLTESGLYQSATKDGEYTKKADGKWSQGKVQNGPAEKGFGAKKNTGNSNNSAWKESASAGGNTTKPATSNSVVSADPLTALKAHVRDSVMHLMKLPALTNKAIADKKIDKKNLETVAADIARQYLATLKKSALKKFNGKTIKISAYDKQKQVYTLIWNTDIFTVVVPVAESESFKTNWSKLTFSDPDLFFDGSKFRLSAVKITNPVLKKAYAYDSRGQKKSAPVLKVNDLDVTLPAS